MKIKVIIGIICVVFFALFWFVIKPMMSPIYEVPNGTAEMHFIDVWQGDSTLIMVGEQTVLIDTGEKDAKNALLNYLDEHSVTVIDYFIITHYDSDHFANAQTVLETYDVKTLITPDQTKSTNMYKNFFAVAKEQKSAKKIICHKESFVFYERR